MIKLRSVEKFDIDDTKNFEEFIEKYENMENYEYLNCREFVNLAADRKLLD